MNKMELVSAIAEKSDLSKRDAEAALNAFTDIVAEELKKGEKIQLVGFGTFEVSERAERTFQSYAKLRRRSGRAGDGRKLSYPGFSRTCSCMR